MRKDSIRVINEVLDDIIGGFYNSMLDDRKKDFKNLTKENFVKYVYERAYSEAVNEENNIRFEGKENLKSYIIKKLTTDNEVLEIIDYL